MNTSAPNGGVEDLFTVTGRSDAGACTVWRSRTSLRLQSLEQHHLPNSHADLRRGLIENLDDSTLLKNRQANLRNSFGIAGAFNHNGNDGTITRFGWKAQNKSLHIFAGEAYNVEMGVSNLLVPTGTSVPEEDQLGTGLPGELPEPCREAVTRKTRPTQTRRRMQRFWTMSRRLPTSCDSWRRLHPGGSILNGQPVPASAIAAGRPCSAQSAAPPATIRTLARRKPRTCSGA